MTDDEGQLVQFSLEVRARVTPKDRERLKQLVLGHAKALKIEGDVIVKGLVVNAFSDDFFAGHQDLSSDRQGT